MYKKTYIFDLDDTLCSTPYGVGPDGKEGPQYYDAVPIIERIEKVNNLYEDGHTIIIDSARGKVSGKSWFYFTLDQLKNWGLKFHHLRVGEKFIADHYVDDKAINSEVFFHEDSLNKESGSGVSTNVVIVSRVLKEATKERMNKLIDEINFLENIPEKFKDKFSRIIFSRVEHNKVFYEMEHHNLPSFRRLILSGEMDDSEIIYWIRKITDFSMNLYSYKKIDISRSILMKQLHWQRFENRMSELRENSSYFRAALDKKELDINGMTYKNLEILYPKIKARESWFYPDFISRWSHSDLHFSNILIDRNKKDFVLLDPRGYSFCEYYYDFGKLWHSVHGKYELIAERMFSVSNVDDVSHTFEIHKNKAYITLENSKNDVSKILCEYSNEDFDIVMLKTEFNNVMHFASLIPFLLEFDDQEERARAAYYQSIILLNEFCKNYGVL